MENNPTTQPPAPEALAQPPIQPAPPAPPQPQPMPPMNMPPGPTANPQPAYGPAAPQPVPQPAPQPPHTNASVIVLQWLTYALWGWTVLAMSFLTAIVLTSFIAGTNTEDSATYAIAAILVLLPISMVCDHFYSKKEPAKKTGAASIVMVIHAVIFALFAVGSLIAAVFCVVTMLTSSSETKTTQIALYSALIIMVLYTAVLLRTLNPQKLPWIRRFFIIFMIVVVGIIAVLGIVGPTANARLTKNDRLITSNIGSLSQSIDSYAYKNHRLPDSLDNLDLSGDTKKLVSDKLVDYTANTKSPAADFSDSTYGNGTTITTINPKINSSTIYYYQLCVNYKKSNKDGNDNNYDRYNNSNDGYTDNLYVYTHDSGKVCYKVKTSINYNY